METTSQSQDESESDEQEQPLETKPLRSLAPMLPLPMGYDVATQSTDPTLVFVTPFRPCTSPEANSFGRQPPAPLRATPISAAFPMPRPTPLKATPVSAAAPAFRMPRHEDESSEEEYNPFCGRKKPTQKRTQQQAECSNARDMKRRPTQRSLTLNKELATTLSPSSSSDPTESVQETLMMFDSLRRRILQLDEDAAGKRADLKAGSLMMQNGLRINTLKTVGPVPGVVVGDIFFFRMEMCVVGLHAPAMAGIDYVSARRGGSGTDEVVAVSVVSSGGYENDDTDSDVLVYTGQGGSSRRRRKDKHEDQRLERGNLALVNSMERRSVVRVVRGAQDPSCRSSKIYVYDGLYRVEGSWTERAKDGFSVFKYKLRREPGQRDGISVWKTAEKWRADPATRNHVVSADMSSNAEKLPVCLVNDGEQRVPGRFNYVTGVEYPRTLGKTKPPQGSGCKCPSVCLPSDADCSCARLNGGHLPYTACGLLVKRVPVLYECGSACRCSGNCRNRVAQKGVRLRLEVFWTGDACGWGVRSWDPIRAGAFVCEYAGQAVDVSTDGEEDEYAFCASGEGSRGWNLGAELVEDASGGSAGAAAENLEERLPVPVVISARRSGNVARFLNHSCSPNLLWQPVRYGDGGYPHVMFFAMRHVPPMTQLTYDYGTTRGAAAPGFQGKFPNACRLKPCFCGSTSCRGSF